MVFLKILWYDIRKSAEFFSGVVAPDPKNSRSGGPGVYHIGFCGAQEGTLDAVYPAFPSRVAPDAGHGFTQRKSSKGANVSFLVHQRHVAQTDMQYISVP